MLVDAHTHVWPDAIAERAVQPPSPGIEPRGDGRAATLVDTLAAAGIDAAVCLAIANEGRHLGAANAFAASLPEPLLGFGSVHVDLDVETNLASLRANGLRGVKLNPPFQGFALDDPRLLMLLDALQGEFVVLTHVGGGGPAGSEATCTPEMVRELVRLFPRLELIAAHFGGYRMLDVAEAEVIGLPVYIDTSWPPGLASLEPRRVRAIIERHGPERVLFGTDWPMSDPAADLAALAALGLGSDAFEAVAGGNAARLLSLVHR